MPPKQHGTRSEPVPARCLTTPQLLAAHARSLAGEQNRLLTEGFLDAPDPNAIHAANFVMEHENCAGTKGVRTQLRCKTRCGTEPVVVFFDFMVDDYTVLALRCGRQEQAA
jgi:hypothetical protein